MIQHLFQASSLNEVSRQRLEAFVEEYPSFGIGHYLLSRKLRSEGSERFALETQKTNLYFTNPFWLQWQLDDVEPATSPEVPVVVAEESVAVFDVPVQVEEAPVQVGEEPVALAEEPVAVTGSVATVSAESFELPQGDDLAEALSRGSVADETSAADRLLRSIQEAKDLRESLHRLNDDFAAETSVAGEPPPVATEEPIRDAEAPFVLEEVEEPAAQSEPMIQPEPTPQAQPANNVANDLVFEPFHTIDYFASQGIKLTQDENPTDVLGKQLKSFTDWLKGMRRLPQKDREVVPDRVLEQAVQSIAAHSIEGKEVLTETMGDVLAKQGMRERAKAVYEKLSLLNPEKRAYFAAKIEQLNIL